jgi:hypothetical protein
MPRCLIEWSFRTKLVPLLTAMRRTSYGRARDTERSFAIVLNSATLLAVQGCFVSRILLLGICDLSRTDLSIFEA